MPAVRRSFVRRSPVRRSPVRRSPVRRSPVRRSPDRHLPVLLWAVPLCWAAACGSAAGGAEETADPPALLRLLPADALFAGVVDAERVLADPLLDRLAPVLTDRGGLFARPAERMGLSMEDLAAAAMFVPQLDSEADANRRRRGPEQPVFLFRTVGPAALPAGLSDTGHLRLLPDGRTLVLCDDPRSAAVAELFAMERADDVPAAPPANSAAALAIATAAALTGGATGDATDGAGTTDGAGAGGPAALVYGDLRRLREEIVTGIDRSVRNEDEWLPIFGLVRPAVVNADVFALTANLEAGALSVRLTARARNRDAAGRLERTAAAAITLGENLAEGLPAAMLRNNPGLGTMVVPVAAAARRLLGNAAVARNGDGQHDGPNDGVQNDDGQNGGGQNGGGGTRVTVTTNLDAATLTSMADLAAAFLRPFVEQAHNDARLRPRQNNLKQIGLALHIYHAQHKHFPPAVVVENGVRRSWRVELLPFLDESKLWEAYRKDQPWDSPANKAVLAKMPAVYRLPGDRRPGFLTGYVAVQDATDGGQGRAAWIGETPLGIRDMRDGTVNTALAVESPVAAGRAIPWTKPEDVTVDLSKPVPPAVFLGPATAPGAAGAKLLILFVDGSVRTFDANLDPNTLRAMLTRNGGEVVDIIR